jgi:hypothetical protein
MPPVGRKQQITSGLVRQANRHAHRLRCKLLRSRKDEAVMAVRARAGEDPLVARVRLRLKCLFAEAGEVTRDLKRYVDQVVAALNAQPAPVTRRKSRARRRHRRREKRRRLPALPPAQLAVVELRFVARMRRRWHEWGSVDWLEMKDEWHATLRTLQTWDPDLHTRRNSLRLAWRRFSQRELVPCPRRPSP